MSDHDENDGYASRRRGCGVLYGESRGLDEESSATLGVDGWWNWRSALTTELDERSRLNDSRKTFTNIRFIRGNGVKEQ